MRSNRCRIRRMGRPWPVAAMGRHGSFVGCVHRSAKGRPRRTYEIFQFGVFFAGWADPGQWQLGAPVVGCVHRSEKGRPRRTYLVRRIGVVFAGWADLGQWQYRRNGSFVGRVHRSAKGRPRRTYGMGSYRCRIPRMGRPWPVAVMTARFVCGMCPAVSKRPSSRDIRELGMVGVFFAGWADPGQWQ